MEINKFGIFDSLCTVAAVEVNIRSCSSVGPGAIPWGVYSGIQCSRVAHLLSWCHSGMVWDLHLNTESDVKCTHTHTPVVSQ